MKTNDQRPLILLLAVVFLVAECRAEKFWWEKMRAVQLTKANYESVLGKDQYVFVEFYSKSCGWCERLYPALNQLVEDMDTGEFPRKDIVVAKIDAEEFADIAKVLQVQKYPTMYLYKPNDALYPEKYEYSHNLVHIKQYLLTHPIAPKFAKSVSSSEELKALQKKLSELEKDDSIKNISSSDSLKEALVENQRQVAATVTLLTNTIKEFKEKSQAARHEQPRAEQASHNHHEDFDYQYAWIVRILGVACLGTALSLLRLKLKNVDAVFVKHQ